MLALMLAQTAAAGPMLHAEAVTTVATMGDRSLNLGTGYGLRAGLPVDVLLVELVPEIGVTVWQDAELTIIPEAGARFNFGKVLEPGAYAHVAYIPGTVPTWGWDAGVALDVTVIPKIDFGVQAGLQRYGEVMPSLTAGFHAGIKL